MTGLKAGLQKMVVAFWIADRLWACPEKHVLCWAAHCSADVVRAFGRLAFGPH